MLRLFGIDESTELVYRAMLDEPLSGVNELATALQMSPSDVRIELDRLAELTLIRPDGEGSRFVPAPPDVALEALLGNAERRLSAEQAAIESARTALPNLVERFVASRPHVLHHGHYEEITEPELVRSRLFALANQATKRAATMINGGTFTPDVMSASLRLDQSMIERGVAVDVLVTADALSSPNWRTYLEDDAELGARVRVHPSPPMLLVLFDDDVAVIPHESSHGACVLRGRDLVAPATALFHQVWEHSTPLPQANPVPEQGDLSARQRQVLHLMAEGHTDEVIARRLRLSTRSVRRLVAEVCIALNAQSRFQAGVIACTQGWVKP